MKIGIIGLPNVGKSTLFKALTKKPINISNYPFCTIDPNIGLVNVPDERLIALAQISQSAKVVPTTIEFVDIAGLVKNAHKGEGLGNQFLSHIREVDAIVQVVRNFSDSKITHVENEINPKNDIEIINLELVMADLNTITKRIADIQGKAHSGDKKLIKILNTCEKIKTALDNGQLSSTVELSTEEQKLIKDLNLLTQKPILYVLNIDEKNINKKNPNSEFRIPNSDTIPISAKIESELTELPKNEAKEYMQELGLKTSGLNRLIAASYKLLNLITFFTSGPKETHAWTVKKNTKAPQAAGKIHTDFEQGFIKAEIINWQNFVKINGEHNAKKKGLMRLEGKNYIIQDGDVCYFHSHM